MPPWFKIHVWRDTFTFKELALNLETIHSWEEFLLYARKVFEARCQRFWNYGPNHNTFMPLFQHLADEVGSMMYHRVDYETFKLQYCDYSSKPSQNTYTITINAKSYQRRFANRAYDAFETFYCHDHRRQALITERFQYLNPTRRHKIPVPFELSEDESDSEHYEIDFF